MFHIFTFLVQFGQDTTYKCNRLGSILSSIPKHLYSKQQKTEVRIDVEYVYYSDFVFSSPHSFSSDVKIKKNKKHHCQIKCKIKYQNRRKRQNRYCKHTNTWPRQLEIARENQHVGLIDRCHYCVCVSRGICKSELTENG